MSSEAWLQLWSEFNFANPDAAGYRGASRCQLRLATQVAEQRLNINEAVREGHLTAETVVDRYGVEKTVRYRLNLAGGMT